jgi:hypothetical protein
LDVVQVLVEAGGKELVMLTDGEGRSCLCIAAQQRRLDVVRALVGAGGKELMMLTPAEDSSRPFIAFAVEQCEAMLLALALGTHSRLGQDSALRAVGLPSELLAMVGDAFWGTHTQQAGRGGAAP